MRARAVILAGGEGSRLGVLTEKRAKPAVPFAGKYRIIDFTLSNCVNSGISDVMILTQYRPHSLNEHIASGRPWDLDRSFTGGVQIYQPYPRPRRRPTGTRARPTPSRRTCPSSSAGRPTSSSSSRATTSTR